MPRMRILNTAEQARFEHPPAFNSAERKRYFNFSQSVMDAGTGPAQPGEPDRVPVGLRPFPGDAALLLPGSNIMSATLLLFPVWSGLLPMCFPAKLTRKGPVCTIRVAFSICKASGLSKLRPKTS